MTCQPYCVCTGFEISPGLQGHGSFRELGRRSFDAGVVPSAPPFFADCVSMESFFARASKSASVAPALGDLLVDLLRLRLRLHEDVLHRRRLVNVEDLLLVELAQLRVVGTRGGEVLRDLLEQEHLPRQRVQVVPREVVGRERLVDRALMPTSDPTGRAPS